MTLDPKKDFVIGHMFSRVLTQQDTMPIDYARLEKLLDRGVDINATMALMDLTPLMYAVTAKDLPLVEWLFDHGAFPDQRQEASNLPLFIAIDKRWLAGAERILKQGPDLSGPQGRCDLFSAIFFGYEDLAIAMLEKNVDWRMVPDGSDQESPLFFAVMKGQARLLKALHEKGEDLTLRCNAVQGVGFGSDAQGGIVACAAAHGSIECLDYLLSQNLPLADERFPPLCAAAIMNQVAASKWLMGHGANPLQTYRGMAPLELALHYNTVACAEYLAYAGVDLRKVFADPDYLETIPSLMREDLREARQFILKERNFFLKEMILKDLPLEQCLAATHPRRNFIVAVENDGRIHPLHELFEHSESDAVETASPSLRRIAGAGLLPSLFQPEDWKHRAPNEARELAARITHALPVHFKSFAQAIDLTWTKEEERNQDWKIRITKYDVPKGPAR